MIDEFNTTSKNCRYDLKDKGSKFIGLSYKIESNAEADEIIKKNKKEYYDATHNCFAYRLGLDLNSFRYNDDGEPSGTAGKPILNAIDQLSLTNVLVIVNRYFGGTKLGVPGLIRAYHDTAYETLKCSQIEKRIITKKLKLTFSHNLISNVMHILSIKGIQIKDQIYDENVNLIIEVRLTSAEDFSKNIFEAMNGKIQINDFSL